MKLMQAISNVTHATCVLKLAISETIFYHLYATFNINCITRGEGGRESDVQPQVTDPVGCTWWVACDIAHSHGKQRLTKKSSCLLIVTY